MSIRRSVALAALLTLLGLTAWSKPRRELIPQPAPPAPATPAPAVEAPPPAAPTPAAILTAEKVDAYLKALEPVVAGLRASDARFAARFKGTAVPLADLVDPGLADARDALVRAHGYASWADFNQTHERIAGCLALIVSRTLRMMNVGANMNRAREIEEQLAKPDLHPEERTNLQAMLDQLRTRNQAMRDKPPSSPLIPEADVEVVGKRQADLSAAFARLRKPAGAIAPITTAPPAPTTMLPAQPLPEGTPTPGAPAPQAAATAPVAVPAPTAPAAAVPAASPAP